MQIETWFIPKYTMRVVGGLLAAVTWLWIAGIREGIPLRQLSTLLWMALLGVVLGSRCGYIAQHLEYFTQNPGDALLLWRVGGMDGPGGWIGGLAASALWIWHSRYPARRIARLLVPAALLLSAGAWWGCSDAGCAWGREVATTLPEWQRWLVYQAPDLYRTFAPRYAVQYLAMAMALTLTAAAVIWRRHDTGFLAMYLAGLTGLTLLRADPVPLLGSVRLDTVFYGVLAVGLSSTKMLRHRDYGDKP